MPRSRRNALKMPAPQTVERALDTLLEGHYPLPEGLHRQGLDKPFARRHDDTDGKLTPDQSLGVMFTPDLDAWVVSPVGMDFQALRFRTAAGGGRSPRVHRALLILAEAIRRDNEESPQPPDYQEF